MVIFWVNKCFFCVIKNAVNITKIHFLDQKYRNRGIEPEMPKQWYQQPYELWGTV